MSFLVVFNGQFSPLVHPTSSAVRTGIPPVNSLSKLNEVDEFKELLEEVKQNEGLKKSYQKLEVYKQATKTFEEQRKRHHAKDIMTYPVIVISQNSSVFEAQTLLNKYRFRHLPVVDDKGMIVGMISDRELAGKFENKSCKDIMTNKIIVCEEHASVNEIAIILLKERINALPIINHKRELTGIITLSNILQFVIASTAFLGKA